MRALRARCADHVLGTRGVLVSVVEQPGACPSCGGPMIVQKTTQRHVATLEYGQIEARETVHACKVGCRFPNGKVLIRRAQELARCVPPRMVVGYDVMVRVGLERYLHHRQREEIRADLSAEYGIELSSGEISVLSRRFLEYLEALHEARAPDLRAALAADGGWPLHVDATGENGRGTLLAAFTAWRGWVLGVWKIPTERADAILPHLREVVARFGPPCAVMRDLGRAMIPAVRGLVEGLPGEIPVFSCHLHFLGDVGRDLLDTAHARLRSDFRRLRTRPKLRTLARDLGRKLGEDLEQGRESLKSWRDDQTAGHVVPGGPEGLAVIRGVAQWVLDYAADSDRGTFPFDRPYLDLYERCCRARRAADAFSRRPPEDPKVRRALDRLIRALDPVANDDQAAKAAETLRKRAELFDELRDALRLVGTRAGGPSEGSSSQQLSPEEASADLDDIRVTFETWVASLRERRPERGPAKDTRQAIDVILAHVDRHGHTLWGHAIALPAKVGAGVRLVDRTNNAEENLWHDFKHGERRRSGHKILTHDLETLPPAAVLVQNLRRSDYVVILCGSLERLPAEFAALDAQRVAAERARSAESGPTAEKAKPLVTSSSLPTADRRIVRSEAMNRRVERAARSRAPRTGSVTAR